MLEEFDEWLHSARLVQQTRILAVVLRRDALERLHTRFLYLCVAISYPLDELLDERRQGICLGNIPSSHPCPLASHGQGSASCAGPSGREAQQKSLGCRGLELVAFSGENLAE